MILTLSDISSLRARGIRIPGRDPMASLNVRRRCISSMKPGDMTASRLVRFNPKAETTFIAIDGLVLPSLANLREIHWSRAKRAREQRSRVMSAMVSVSGGIPPLPVSVQITRVYGGRGRALDSDNCTISAKNVRDEIAAVYSVDDNDPRITWLPVSQRKAKTSCVEVVIEARRAGE